MVPFDMYRTGEIAYRRGDNRGSLTRSAKDRLINFGEAPLN